MPEPLSTRGILDDMDAQLRADVIAEVVAFLRATGRVAIERGDWDVYSTAADLIEREFGGHDGD